MKKLYALEKISEKEKNFFNILKAWLSNSPSHGIKRIYHASSTIERLFWSIIFLAFTTLMCIFIYTVIMKYITYPTKINLSVRHHRERHYLPAITFCNLNPLRDENVLHRNIYRKTATARNARVILTDVEYRKRFNEHMTDFLVERFNKKQPTIIQSGYQLKDLLLRCQFNGRHCWKNLTSFFHPDYGNCYTFDHNKNVSPKIRKSLSYFWSIDDNIDSGGYKLYLQLFLYQNEYLSRLDERAAFRLFIHRKEEIPILSESSLFVAPTTFTKLVFSQRIITFSHQCRTELPNSMKQVFHSANIQYSQALCYKLCKFRFIEHKCECIDPLFLVFLQFFTPNRTKTIKRDTICSIEQECYVHNTNLNLKEECAECLSECEIVQYTIQSSYASYPNLRSMDSVLQNVEKRINSTRYSTGQSNAIPCSNNRRAALLDDIVAIEISASPYAIETLSESPMYTWVDLISSIGGQTGLWIGVSLISFVEIIELFYLIFYYAIGTFIRQLYLRWVVFYERFTDTKLTARF